MPVSPIPPGYHTVTPYITVRGAAQAIAFYQQAFGATELYRLSLPDGSIAHAEIRVGDSVVMLGDENPAWGNSGPQTLGGPTGSLCVYLPDVDAAFARAVAAGATPAMPVADQFWGDRSGKVTDPFGHVWMLSTRVEDVAPEEMGRRMAAFMQQAA